MQPALEFAQLHAVVGMRDRLRDIVRCCERLKIMKETSTMMAALGLVWSHASKDPDLRRGNDDMASETASVADSSTSFASSRASSARSRMLALLCFSHRTGARGRFERNLGRFGKDPPMKANSSYKRFDHQVLHRPILVDLSSFFLM